MQNFSPVKTTHYLIAPRLQSAKTIIDATCGTGKDCLFLAQNSSVDAKIWAFDIQDLALTQTSKLLRSHNIVDKVTLVYDNYVNWSEYCSTNPDIVIFNLGYLPGGDKNITTQVCDLQAALPVLLTKLNTNGTVYIVAYSGHSAGYDEYVWLKDYLQSLPFNQYNVGQYILFNHKKAAPILYIIEKL